jgi:hypothetical protein
VRRGVALLSLACAASAALAAPGVAATPELRLIATDRGPAPSLGLVADATRFYAWPASTSHIKVVDDVAQRRANVAGCPPRDARAGELLVDCGGASDPRVIEIDTGTSVSVADADAGGRRFPDTLFALGRHWIGGTSCEDPGHCAQVYLNRRTGERRLFSVDGSDDVTTLQLDIDTPDLRPLAAPGVFSERIGNYTVSQRRRGSGHELVLTEGSRRRVLSRCTSVGAGCTSITFGGSLVTWAEGGTAYVYRLRSRRPLGMRPPTRADSDSRDLVVRHTRRSVLVLAVDVLGASDQARALYRAAAPTG